MYNRYIPQSDGTYRRNRMQDTSSCREPCPQERITQKPQKETASCIVPPPAPPCPKPPRPNHGHQGHRNNSIERFLHQLLPKDFDTGDLLVIILLLLMSGDCNEDQNSALLTLALYLFL